VACAWAVKEHLSDPPYGTLRFLLFKFLLAGIAKESLKSALAVIHPCPL